METIHFSILINAPKEKVWQTMLDDKTYRQWTAAFHEGSYYVGGWNKGDEIRFIGPGEKGKEEGMYSRIKDNKQYQFISIEHLGIIKDGKVDTTSAEVKKWAPSFENYTFTQKGDQTEVKVDMQISEEYKSAFDQMWPRALHALKQLSEKK